MIKQSQCVQATVAPGVEYKAHVYNSGSMILNNVVFASSGRFKYCIEVNGSTIFTCFGVPVSTIQTVDLNLVIKPGDNLNIIFRNMDHQHCDAYATILSGDLRALYDREFYAALERELTQ